MRRAQEATGAGPHGWSLTAGRGAAAVQAAQCWLSARPLLAPTHAQPSACAHAAAQGTTCGLLQQGICTSYRVRG